MIYRARILLLTKIYTQRKLSFLGHAGLRGDQSTKFGFHDQALWNLMTAPSPGGGVYKHRLSLKDLILRPEATLLYDLLLNFRLTIDQLLNFFYWTRKSDLSNRISPHLHRSFLVGIHFPPFNIKLSFFECICKLSLAWHAVVASGCVTVVSTIPNPFPRSWIDFNPMSFAFRDQHLWVKLRVVVQNQK